MTPGYDVELLHVELDRARVALAAVQRHKTPYWITWRLARLRRETLGKKMKLFYFPYCQPNRKYGIMLA